MADVLFAAGAIVLVLTAAGIALLWRRGGDSDRLLAIQLLGSASIAVLLLLAVAMRQTALLDIALMLAVLAALAAGAYRAASRRAEKGP